MTTRRKPKPGYTTPPSAAMLRTLRLIRGGRALVRAENPDPDGYSVYLLGDDPLPAKTFRGLLARGLIRADRGVLLGARYSVVYDLTDKGRAALTVPMEAKRWPKKL